MVCSFLVLVSEWQLRVSHLFFNIKTGVNYLLKYITNHKLYQINVMFKFQIQYLNSVFGYTQLAPALALAIS